MSKEIEEDVSIIKNIIYFDNERVSYIDIDDFCDNECEKFIQAIESILKENEANKKRIEELEEERKLLNTEYVDNIPEGWYIGINKLQYKEYLYLKSNSIPKAKIEEIIQKLDVDIERNNRAKEEVIKRDLEGRYVNHIIAYKPEIIKQILEELLKDGGEYDYK